MLFGKNASASARFLFQASILAAIFALIGALGVDIYLASTQWVLVAVLLVSWANFLRR